MLHLAPDLSPFPWTHAIGFGLGVLRLSPDAFWRMTPREFALAARAVIGPVARRSTAAAFARPDEEISRWTITSSLVKATISPATTETAVGAHTRPRPTSANGFARAMSTAFTRGITDGKSFDDVLKSLALRLSSLTVSAALRPVDQRHRRRAQQSVQRLVRRLRRRPGQSWREPRRRDGRDQAVRGRRRHRHADLLSARRPAASGSPAKPDPRRSCR